MRKFNEFKKPFLILLIVFVVATVHSPIYHQHFDSYHTLTLNHSDNIAIHHASDNSLHSHETIFQRDNIEKESHHSHYHAHVVKDTYRVSRIDLAKLKHLFTTTIGLTNGSITPSRTRQRNSSDFYNPCFDKYYAKTFSGLSPPSFSS